MQPKNIQFRIVFFTIFLGFWPPTWGARGGKNRGFRYFLGAGRPRGAQMAPRWLQDQIFGQFSPTWAIFSTIFNIFLLIFGTRLLHDFRPPGYIFA